MSGGRARLVAQAARLLGLAKPVSAAGIAAAIAGTAFLSGCMVGPDYQRPPAIVPAAYKEQDGWKPSEPRDADVDRLGLGAPQQGLGLHHVRLGDRPRVVLILRDLQRARESRRGIVEQALQLVLLAQTEIVRRKRRLGREAGGAKVGSADLRARHVALDDTANPAPDVDIPAAVERDAVKGLGPRAVAAGSGAAALCGCVEGDGGEQG